MSRWLLWRRGLRGPLPITLDHSPSLGEVDRARKIGSPVQIKPEHEHLDIAALIPLYPCPEQANETPAVVVKLA